MYVGFLTAAQCLFNIWGVVSSSLLKLIGSSALWAWLGLKLPSSEQTAFLVLVDSLKSESSPLGYSAALEISFIVKTLSVKQYGVATFTGAPG